MPDTIRQQLVDKTKLRLAAITTANGYATNLGQRPIDEWPVAYQQDDCPALGVFDLVNRTAQEFPREKRSGNTLPLQVRIFLKRESSPAEVRKMIGDVMKAIITDPATGQRDPTFGGLATDTKPDEDGFIVPNDTFQIDGAAVGFTVEFLSEPFNAYE
jgi:hypothetical protein